MPDPVLGVSVLVRVEDRVLLVRRRDPPLQSLWAFPGGKVMPGERLIDAARREVLEETGVTVGELRQIDMAEIIDRDRTGMVGSHHVVVVFVGASDVEQIAAGDDAAEARWIPLSEAEKLPLTADTARILSGLERD